MSSNLIKDNLELFTEDIPIVEKMNDMSPVTNLALNMKSLTTSLTATPSRRISWSNPFPCDSDSKQCLQDFSPSIDSPTFQVLSSKMKKKSRPHKVSRKVISLDDDEKENVAPDDFISPDINKESFKDEILPDSQDSGYSDMSMKHSEMSSLDSTPRIRSKSSMMVDDEEDGFENIFQMDEREEIKDVNVPDMTSLLTKPLYRNSKLKQKEENCTKKGRLPIRRCLSMEMESSPISQSTHFELISETGTLVALANTTTCTDLEPLKRCPFKRPDPPSFLISTQNKRRKSSPSVHPSSITSVEPQFRFQRSFSETAATIMHAVQKSDLEPDLIGDCSRSYALPLIKGRHQDLKCISGETLMHLLRGEYSQDVNNFTLVDCRYPYEFEGGHIQGALNLYTKEAIQNTFLEKVSSPTSERNIIIFHCEFSSERAPNLCRFLRNKDREANESNYPKLHHPEIYLLDGGYKAFFQNFKEFCEPQDYKPMNHKDHGFELRHFRAKSKSWGADSKSRYKLKSSSTSISEVL